VNRLVDEPSRYLRQHSAQPVDWYPWGPDALARARDTDRPLFLSIGYSACHWCHVMAHESFDDPDIAALLNESFVAVKIDREERPDVDAVYMEAVQALTGQGGWPMSIFATPDGRPFFAGTYFPPHDRGSMPGFDRVLASVREAWEVRRSEVESQADELSGVVTGRSAPPVIQVDRVPPWPRLLATAGEQLHRFVDTTNGGFGTAPKFPQPSLVELLHLHRLLTADSRSIAATTITLGAMAAGGIYDHLAGGFARYATDRSWTVPHFEKMLYDQAGLVRAYLHGWLIDGDRRWLQVVEETVAYVLDDLLLDSGGLASARDADSEGEEGRYYVWTDAELHDVLGDLYAVTAAWYQADGRPVFEGRHILRRPAGAPLARPAEVESGRRLLHDARRRRVAPGRDDKVITEWNAMFVSALAEAAGALERPHWSQTAQTLGDFLWQHLRRPGDGRLMRTWQAGEARHLACAGDYAATVDAFTRLAELTGQALWLDRAHVVAHDMVRLFTVDSGLLASSGSDADPLLVRPVDTTDGAMPSANSAAALALLRLGALTGDDALSTAGRHIVDALAPATFDHPAAMANAVAALVLADGGITEVVVTGTRPDLLSLLRQRFAPNMVTAWGERTGSPLWSERPDDGSAYVCRQGTCRRPTADPADLVDQLDELLRHDSNLLRRAAESSDLALRLHPDSEEPR